MARLLVPLGACRACEPSLMRPAPPRSAPLRAACRARPSCEWPWSRRAPATCPPWWRACACCTAPTPWCRWRCRRRGSTCCVRQARRAGARPRGRAGRRHFVGVAGACAAGAVQRASGSEPLRLLAAPAPGQAGMRRPCDVGQRPKLLCSMRSVLAPPRLAHLCTHLWGRHCTPPTTFPALLRCRPPPHRRGAPGDVHQGPAGALRTLPAGRVAAAGGLQVGPTHGRRWRGPASECQPGELRRSRKGVQHRPPWPWAGRDSCLPVLTHPCWAPSPQGDGLLP